jgi:hypothetical protein
MSEEEVKVGNFTKPVRRPVPAAKATVAAVPVTEAVSEDGIAELNVKMDALLKFMQAIDWKMWVYLKANNYID